ncbi:MAG: ribonuclease HII [Deltaproteobacteria bacterium]|nr:ribonuclease HII [Deltaproteobacteria bacterium]MBW1927636.1 ribonuclease HII [Deltaproteobacteria bacterium]MBW2025589.1 ribonuclease HII [Deltaproteobacteria bacterium]MBW2126193.1 ribonuclease HII [Deltaproteobacteria bacterium]
MSSQAEKLSLFPNLEKGSLEADPFYYEALAKRAGYHNIAGIDEAGRGPLAGPVVAAAVVLFDGTDMEGIRDSKAMTEKARDLAFSKIVGTDVAVGVGVVSHRDIDETNILQATLQAMKRAVESLPVRADFLLVDGIHPVPLDIPQRCIKKGDRLCRSISAASVIAKVYRDRIMYSYHQMYPEYGFDRNKGYGTKDHLKAIKKFGPSPMHRLTFRGVR